MNTKYMILIAPLMLAVSIGCKQEAATTESASTELPSAQLPVVKSQDSGCKVESVDGGAQITCGETSAFLPATANPVKAKVPVLINGPTNGNPENQNVQVGDYLISVTKSSNNTELITIWYEHDQAIAQYENGMIIPRDRAIYYDSRDCSGPGVYQTNPDINSFRFGMGNRFIYWDRFYRLGDTPTHCYPRSKKEKDGTCTEITGPMTGDFNGYVAEPTATSVHVMLSSGYKVRMK